MSFYDCFIYHCLIYRNYNCVLNKNVYYTRIWKLICVWNNNYTRINVAHTHTVTYSDMRFTHICLYIYVYIYTLKI